MIAARSLAAGRAAFERQAWREAFDRLVEADREQPLGPEDLERLAIAAHLIGRDMDPGGHWGRAHLGYLERGDVPRAVRAAFWLAIPLIFRGERAQAGGWIARATRLLDDGGLDCVERGYMMFGTALLSALEGDGATAHARFAEAVACGQRFRDADLVAFARHGQGRALINMGQISQGASLLDEAMAAITAGEVSPLLVGDVYCSVIEACHEMFDMRRAGEWTAALSEWCMRQPDMAPYRGQCLVHRSEIMQLRGEWPSATEEAERARDALLAPPPHRAVGAAYYRLGELHRLRGELTLAEEAYRQASRAGRDPQPGLALLRLACGQIEAARTSIARAMSDPGPRGRRSRILPAFVDVALAAGDLEGARAAADELLRMASDDAPAFIRALAAHACGAVLLAEDDARGALAALRRASALWDELEDPYDAARTRELIGLACRALGDADSATLELEAARDAFESLGAAPDVARVTGLLRAERTLPSSGLTAREVEVLRHIATGKTNRVIANALGISEKTVARHVSNIFTKLNLSSRAAATAFAYEHELLPRRT
jgi:DNA-binding NarL/FixJ family response regulator